MKKTNRLFHGSDIEAVAEQFHIEKKEIVSFSANVNPLGISPKMEIYLKNHLNCICSYPERDYKTLRQAISSYCHAPFEFIFPGNGTTELISSFFKAIHPENVLLIAPTYSEYEREIKLLNGKCTYYTLKENNDFAYNEQELFELLKNESYDMLVLCNPNNPTGTAITSSSFEKILSVCKEKNTFVLVDETYIEFSDRQNEIDSIPLTFNFNNLAVLRGVSKFFASPGLRLGYAVCNNSTMIKKLNSCQNPWSINSLAEAAGSVMFSDEKYINETKQFILSEKERCKKELKKIEHLKFYPSDSNFLFVKIQNPIYSSNELFSYCAKSGLMIRDCSNFPTLNEEFFRFCIMKKEDNDRLLTSFKNYFSSH